MEPAEAYSLFMERNNNKIIRTKNALWLKSNKFIYSHYPICQEILLDGRDFKKLFIRGALAVAYINKDIKESIALERFVIACTDKEYDQHLLGPKAKNRLRKGLRSCDVRIISHRELKLKGFEAWNETIKRQGRKSGLSPKKWNNYCDSLYGLPYFEIWGCFVDNSLASYLVTFIDGECCNVLVHRSNSSLLNYCTNNVLLYKHTYEVIRRKEIRIISHGFKSLENNPGLNSFKINMGYEYIRLLQNIAINPIIKPFSYPLALNNYSKFVKYLNGDLSRRLEAFTGRIVKDNHFD